MRGRGEPVKQQLEPRFDGLTNTLTTVQKDNLILTQEDIGVGSLESETKINIRGDGA